MMMEGCRDRDGKAVVGMQGMWEWRGCRGGDGKMQCQNGEVGGGGDAGMGMREGSGDGNVRVGIEGWKRPRGCR